MDLKLEVVVIPVSDADRAKSFYKMLGFREDADFVISEDFRILQFTPPGSEASIIFGKGVTSAAPGSMQGLMLIVKDIEAARAELASRGADITEVFHNGGGVFGGGVFIQAGPEKRLPGPDPEGNSYSSFASFRDPDGNTWLLQEIKQRLPGR